VKKLLKLDSVCQSYAQMKRVHSSFFLTHSVENIKHSWGFSGFTVLCTIIMVHKGTSSSYRLVGWLYRALIWLGLLCIFQALLCRQFSWCYIYIKNFCLHPSLYLLVSLAWWDWPLTWLTNNHLQCCNTVGWVIWPNKSSAKWHIMCRVGH